MELWRINLEKHWVRLKDQLSAVVISQDEVSPYLQFKACLVQKESVQHRGILVYCSEENPAKDNTGEKLSQA